MKKFILLLLSFFLIGCSTPPPSANNNHSQSTTIIYNDFEKEKIDELIANGHYFDKICTNQDNLSYVLDDSGLTININDNKKITLKFNLYGKFFFEYPFDSITFDYEKNDNQKTATLTSIYKRVSGSEDNLLISKLTTSDGQNFDIYFDSDFDNPRICDRETEDEIVFVDSLSKQIMHTYKQQWSEASLFHSDMINFYTQFEQILKGPAYYLFLDATDQFPSIPINVDWLLGIDENTEKLIPKKYSNNNLNHSNQIYDENLDTNKFYNTLSLLFYLENSYQNNSTIDTEVLAEAILDIGANYTCDNRYCKAAGTIENKIFAYEGISEEYSAYYMLTEDYFIKTVKDIFNIKITDPIHETKLLDSGILQSGLQNYYLQLIPNTNSSPSTGRGILVTDYSIEGSEITCKVVLYEYTHEMNDNDEYELVLLTSDDEIRPGEKYNTSNIDQFIQNNQDNFQRWTVRLEENDNKSFYKIIYANERYGD